MMSEDSLSGSTVKWLLLFLLLLSDLASSVDNPLHQNDTMVCGQGNKAEFTWLYQVKPFLGVVWSYNGRKIASSTSRLSLSDKEITDSRFKARLHFISSKPFSFCLDNATKDDNGRYGCSFTLENGDTDTLLGNMTVKDLRHDEGVVAKSDVESDCVSLSFRDEFHCIWILPNGTKRTSRTISYCSKSPVENITCHCDSDCKYTVYTTENTNEKFKSEGDVNYKIIVGVGVGIGICIGIHAIFIIIIGFIIYCKNKDPVSQSGAPHLSVPLNSN